MPPGRLINNRVGPVLVAAHNLIRTDARHSLLRYWSRRGDHQIILIIAWNRLLGLSRHLFYPHESAVFRLVKPDIFRNPTIHGARGINMRPGHTISQQARSQYGDIRFVETSAENDSGCSAGMRESDQR
jgi:hypothetical protein